MSDIIQLLPDALSNQIAAGEVVQRPASAVKELLENAVDSGARYIELEIRDGGKTLIRVTDNGSGMSFMDARMCFERHATSKIRSVDDLFRIRTKGFRGEAMASIAAIAQVSLKTRRASDELGTEVEIAGSEIRQHRPGACPSGTTVIIRNLFYNVPARRNFLKSNATEARNVINEFLRVALAHPEIHFRMEHQDALIYDLPAADLLGRTLQVFGTETEDDLLKVEEHSPFLTITGFVSKPDAARKVRGDQFFFVNDRFIKDGYLNHAVIEAYSGTLDKDSFPLYVLYLTLDPKHIDINIHPTKTEIKFDDQNAVYQILRSSVRKALGMHHLNPGSSGLSFSGPGPDAGLGPKDATISDFTRQQSSRMNPGDWQALFGDQMRTPRSSEMPAPAPGLFPASVPETTANDSLREIWVYGSSWILWPQTDGILVVDAASARQRVLYESFLIARSGLSGHSQQLLYPQTLNFSAGETELLREREEMLKAAGFELQEFGKNTFLLSAMPAELRGQDATEIISAFLQEAGDRGEAVNLIQEKLARSIARNSRLPRDFALTREAALDLIQKWIACGQPDRTPDGKPISWKLTREEMEKRLLRP